MKKIFKFIIFLIIIAFVFFIGIYIISRMSSESMPTERLKCWHYDTFRNIVDAYPRINKDGDCVMGY